MFRTNLSGSNDLPNEIDYTKLFDKTDKIDITGKKEIEKVYIDEPIIKDLSGCNSGKWQLSLIGSCLLIYFGLPYLFGNK